MGRVGDWPGPSERTAKIIVAVLAALIVGLFVVRAFVPGFGTVEGRHDVVTLGQSIEVLVKRAGNEQVTMTVTEVALLTDAQRQQWRIRPALAPVGSNDGLGDGCAIIAVPAGSQITMVRFYGVALDRKAVVGENWAGWTV